ncbi:MAG: hypothetical protein EZS28_031103, partial [Streblomastix strix]
MFTFAQECKVRSDSEPCSVSFFNLKAETVSVLREEMMISQFFPMQREAIASIYASHQNGMWGDVCVCSPTGSGKTLAYVVPIVDSLSENP